MLTDNSYTDTAYQLIKSMEGKDYPWLIKRDSAYCIPNVFKRLLTGNFSLRNIF